ncbi:hypothetical protein [Ornithinibacillus halotolerans]|uniref:Uncharacterized protein n=1 Tax=Ornithinibacillus halotolerans TaxID=1274357 RepID=A0A916RSY5_9BACI|nr:hypothetical protein [Ornithinibacillus halotolerans]GGA64941.1 hypothetical protein GCM10008025_05940 [Ornithinibacillus halotolerans]
MKVNFTKKQMQQLIRIAEAGNWLANSPRDEAIESYDEIYQYILESAYKMGLEEIQYDKLLDLYFLKPEVEDEIHQLAEEYDSYTFWETLPIKLAERDYEREKHLRNDDPESRFLRITEIEESYIEEFMEDGFEKLVIKK